MASKYHDSIVDDRAKLMPSGDLGDLPLLTTKLYRPPVTPDLEQRARLIERLERNRQRPLTLISAPAGYGKTMLASMWLESCGCSYGWVSLDKYDNDLHTFVSYLLAALRGAFPDIQIKTQSLLDAPTTPSVPVLARYLLNDLDQIPQPFVLVLDDTQYVHEQTAYQLLNELLQHPPPNLHQVLIGRHDPPLNIASLRARSQVTEINAQDLRFTPQETAGLMRQMLDRQIDDAIAEEWTQRTEGWVTALRLAALSLSHRGQTDDLRVAFHGDSRYLRDYLLAEVLTHLPPAKQAWVLKTAILDRFCAPLCEAVCRTDDDPADLSGEKFINRLESENLFLVTLDDKHEWFRFHHLIQQLLVDLLQSYSSTSEISELEVRASRWLSENGWIEEAIQYALRAGDTSGAVGFVAQHRYQLINAERWNQLSRWIGMFPDDVVDNDPILAVTKAFLPSSYGQEGTRLRSRANQLVADLPAGSSVAREVKGEIAYFDLLWLISTGPAAGVIERANDALALLPQRAEYHRSNVISTKALGLQMSGDYKRGVRLINETLNEPEWSATARTKLLTGKSYIFFFEGDLIAAQLWASETLRIASKIQLWHTISEGHYLSGISHYLRNEIDMAEARLSFLIENRLLCAPIFVAQGVCALTRIYRAQRKPEKASEVFSLAFSHLEEVENAYSLDFLRAFQVELALDQGDLALARHLSQSVDFDMDRPVWYHYSLQLTRIKLWLAERRVESLEKARTALERLNQQLQGINRKPHLSEVQALLALVHAAQGDLQRAGECLITALRLGEPGGFIRIFTDLGAPMASLLLRLKEQETDREYADYIDQILAAFPDEVRATVEFAPPARWSGDKAGVTPLLEPLTRRETQILRLLSTELSLQEIAAKLVISPGTVYTHTRNLYSKLDVHTRAEAVHQARELGLI